MSAMEPSAAKGPAAVKAAGGGVFERARTDMFVDKTIKDMDQHAEHMLLLHPVRLLVKALLAGSFITFGGFLSVTLSAGVLESGVGRLLQALGFTAGFSLVILTGTALYTEVNVSFAMYFMMRSPHERISNLDFACKWALVYAGNMLGAIVASAMVVYGNHFDDELDATLEKIIKKKLTERNHGPTVDAWFRVLLSAILGNWMVGIAAYNAHKSSGLVSQVVGIFFPILIFVASGLQHSPANAGYMHLALFEGIDGVTWGAAWLWNIVPASIGNWLGAVFWVAVPIFYSGVMTVLPDNSPAIPRNSKTSADDEQHAQNGHDSADTAEQENGHSLLVEH